MSNLIDEKLGFAQDLLDCCTVPEKLPVDQEFLKPLRSSLKINPLQDEVGSTRSGNEMFGQKGLQLFESLVKDTPVILVDFVFLPPRAPLGLGGFDGADGDDPTATSPVVVSGSADADASALP